MTNKITTHSDYESVRKLVREHIFKYGISEDFLSEPEPKKSRKKKSDKK